MASRFVSTGAIDPVSGKHVEAGEAPVASASGASALGGGGGGGGRAGAAATMTESRNKEAWEAVQREVEEERRKRKEERMEVGEGKSLFEILQENKAAKQAAFDEKAKLSNQFRALDDDEVEFLDDVRKAQRAEEERLKRETEEGLRAFREAQKGGAAAAAAAAAAEEGMEDWGQGRKRKRREKEVKGVRRKSGAKQGASVGEDDKEGGARGESAVEGPGRERETREADEGKMGKQPDSVAKKPKLGGLVDYASDDSSE